MHGVYCGNTCNSCSVHYPRSQYRSDDRGGACTCRTDNRFVAAFFTVSLVRLLLSEKAEAKFSRIDKRPNGKFRVAYYMVNGQEYPNIFPEEGVFRSKLYKTGRIYTVRIDRSRDSYSTGSPAPLPRQALFRG